MNGQYIGCTASSYSFGTSSGSGVTLTISGTFINCTSESYSFGAGFTGATVGGAFRNCVSGSNSFGSGSNAAGSFINCTASDSSFGNTASGQFTQCVAGFNSFGPSGLTGKLYFCRLTQGTYPIPSGSGKIRLCIDGQDDPEDFGPYLP
jgi:hypothetical protein